MIQRMFVTLDTKKTNYKNVGKINHGDDLILELTVLSDGDMISFNDPMVDLLVKKSDGKMIRQNSGIEHIKPNKFVIEVGKDCVTSPGLSTNQLIINDNGRISTCMFYYTILNSLEEDIIESISNVEVLEQLDEYVIEARERMELLNNDINELKEFFGVTSDTLVEAEMARNEAEQNRILSEILRVNNENDRIDADNIRNQNESIRNQNEIDRSSSELVREQRESERILNEEERRQNESERMIDESTRQQNESTRQSNESIRISNETDRKTQENRRVTTETNRVNAETTRRNNENSRISNETERQKTMNEMKSLIEEINSSLDTMEKSIPPYYNVLQYGFNNKGTEDNSGKFKELITEVFKNGGGVIYFPTGTYLGNFKIYGEYFYDYVGEDFSKSRIKIKIEGDGYSTVIKPFNDNNSSIIFDLKGKGDFDYNFLKYFSFENLFLESSYSLGFKLSYVQNIDFQNVVVRGCAKGGLLLYDAWDCTFDNLQLIYCGYYTSESDFSYALSLSGVNTNGCKFSNCRVELSPLLLEVHNNAVHNYFDNVKFEVGGNVPISPKSSINFNGGMTNAFNNCMFVNAQRKSEIIGDDNLLHINNGHNFFNVTNVNYYKKRKKFISFSNCNFVTPVGTYVSNWGKFYNTQFNNCSFDNCDPLNQIEFYNENQINNTHMNYIVNDICRLPKILGELNNIDVSITYELTDTGSYTNITAWQGSNNSKNNTINYVSDLSVFSNIVYNSFNGTNKLICPIYKLQTVNGAYSTATAYLNTKYINKLGILHTIYLGYYGQEIYVYGSDFTINETGNIVGNINNKNGCVKLVYLEDDKWHLVG